MHLARRGPGREPSLTIAPALIALSAFMALAGCSEPTAGPPEAGRPLPEAPPPRADLVSPVGTSTTGIPLTVVPDLDEGTARAITGSSVVFGDGRSPAFTDSRRRAFMWNGSGSPVQLEEVNRGSAVNGANDQGQAVGYVVNPSNSQRIPFIWSAATGLQTFSPPPGATSLGNAEAEAIDEYGNVAGNYLPAGDGGVFFKPDGAPAFSIGIPGLVSSSRIFAEDMERTQRRERSRLGRGVQPDRRW